jgi:flagellar biosynthesis chaperone FliJ
MVLMNKMRQNIETKMAEGIRLVWNDQRFQSYIQVLSKKVYQFESYMDFVASDEESAINETSQLLSECWVCAVYGCRSR